VKGGRKTNGGAVTDPITVLYDGPRRFVALLHTIIYEDANHVYPLVDLKITVVFNKVKKQVILYKDIKRLDTRKSVGAMQIEFSERGEWDLGAGAPPKAYADIYEGQLTEYDHHYQSWYTNAPSGYDGTYDLLQIIDDDSDYIAWAAWWPKPLTSYVEAINLINREIILNTMTTYEETWTVTGSPRRVFVIDDYEPIQEPTDNELGLWSENPMVFVDNTFQVEDTHYTYNAATNNITFAPAYAVSPGSTVMAVYKIDAGKNDMSQEPGVPFANAEWACVMDETTDQFRAVTVYGVSDYNDAVDDAGPSGIDSEIQFYMDETFNPYDLKQAVHKDTRRWVYKKTLTTSTSSVVLPEAPFLLADWDAYCTFAERILVNDVLKRPERAPGSPNNYYITRSSTTGKATVTFTPALPAGTRLKILYSTLPEWSDSGTVALTDYVNNQANVSLPQTVSTTMAESGVLVAMDPLGLDIRHNYTGMDPTVAIYGQEPINFTETLTFSYAIEVDDFKVMHDPNLDPDDDVDTQIYTYDTMNETGTYFDAIVAPSGYRWFEIDANYENTVVDDLYIQVSLDITVARWENATHSWTNVTCSPSIYYSYSAHQEGSYEWMVVGKDAKSIDSAGAAYMTQAFDSKKQIHVTTTGLDINEESWGPEAPHVMGGAMTGTRTDYYFDYPNDMRPSIRDDWCTTVAVSSSNMLFSGGPRANLGTEYFNEFTMAFYASNEWVVNNTGHQDEILALSCWDKHSYGSGYATISVYKDLNGTIGFLIWGIDGQDTYFAAKWFWDSGIYYLQQENDGVTDIIIKINYTPCPPTVSIVERLGTISHKEQHDCPPTEFIP
jgi:hypothetical protein